MLQLGKEEASLRSLLFATKKHFIKTIVSCVFTSPFHVSTKDLPLGTKNLWSIKNCLHWAGLLGSWEHVMYQQFHVGVVFVFVSESFC